VPLTGRQRALVRWARDHARSIVLAGLGFYALDFFLRWLWEIETGVPLRGLGIAIGLLGAGCGLLWFVDAGEPQR
jgi:hypothetical protein